VSGVALAGGIVLGLLLAEARVSRAQERRLLARGAICPPGDGYRLMAAIYPGAFLAMAAEGLRPFRVVDTPHDACGGVHGKCFQQLGGSLGLQAPQHRRRVRG
jgi:hypothetical protein